MTAPRRRWPSEKALQAAIAAMQKAAGGVGGVRVHEDGSFDVLAPGEAADLEGDGESAKVAARIREAARKAQ